MKRQKDWGCRYLFALKDRIEELKAMAKLDSPYVKELCDQGAQSTQTKDDYVNFYLNELAIRNEWHEFDPEKYPPFWKRPGYKKDLDWFLTNLASYYGSSQAKDAKETKSKIGVSKSKKTYKKALCKSGDSKIELPAPLRITKENERRFCRKIAEMKDYENTGIPRSIYPMEKEHQYSEKAFEDPRFNQHCSEINKSVKTFELKTPQVAKVAKCITNYCDIQVPPIRGLYIPSKTIFFESHSQKEPRYMTVHLFGTAHTGSLDNNAEEFVSSLLNTDCSAQIDVFVESTPEEKIREQKEPLVEQPGWDNFLSSVSNRCRQKTSTNGRTISGCYYPVDIRKILLSGDLWWRLKDELGMLEEDYSKTEKINQTTFEGLMKQARKIYHWIIANFKHPYIISKMRKKSWNPKFIRALENWFQEKNCDLLGDVLAMIKYHGDFKKKTSSENLDLLNRVVDLLELANTNVMDFYTMMVLFESNHGKVKSNVFIFTGAVHTMNYIDFFNYLANEKLVIMCELPTHKPFLVEKSL